MEFGSLIIILIQCLLGKLLMNVQNGQAVMHIISKLSGIVANLLVGTNHGCRN